MKLPSKLLFLGAVVAGGSLHAQTTGFTGTGAGPYDYNFAGNWVGGNVNGIWDSTLTIGTGQTTTFGGNTVLSSGFDFLYNGNFDLTLRSDGTANRTITLGGNILVNPVNNRTITIGSTTANQGLNVNLGGDRVFTVAGSKTLRFQNAISGGDFNVAGTSLTAVGGTVRLSGDGATATSSDILVNRNATLQFDSSVAGNLGATRAQSVTLASGGRLVTTGNATTNSVDTIAGKLSINGGEYRPGNSGNNIATVTVTPNAARNSLLNIESLERENHGVVLLRGTNLGANSIASTTANSGNIQVTGAVKPTLVGGGGVAGSTNISIVSWAIGGTTAADTGSTFVTYTDANGFRPLSISEFAADFSGSATNNVRIGAATAIVADVTANSLIVAGGTLSGANKVTVTSGAVLLNGGNSTIATGLDFGAAEGVIGYTRGNTISGIVAGTGGLTVYGTRTDEALIVTNGASTYTGNTTVLGNLQVASGFLASGARTGDVYVYGNLQLAVGGFTGTINGLFGNGTVSYGNSSVSTLAIGDNNVSSTFTGTIVGNANLNVQKVGSGTLTLTSQNTYGRATSILGGTLEVTNLANGGVASGIGSSAATASNLIINNGTLKYSGAATSTDRLFQVGQTTNGGIATLDASGSGAVSFTNTGSLTYGTAGTAGVAQTRSLILTGDNAGDNTLAAVIGNNGAAVNGNSAVSLTKNGAGKWILTGNSTYTGATAVNAGTLLVNGSLGNSAVSVNAGTLGGAGSIGGSTVFAAGAKLSAGSNSAVDGNLTFANGLNLSASSNDTGAYLFDLGAVASSDKITLTSGLANALNVGTLDAADFTFTTVSGFGVGTYVLFDASSTIAGSIGTATVNFGGGLTGTLSIDSINNDVLLTVVPEPSVAALAALGVVGVCVRRRTRR